METPMQMDETNRQKFHSVYKTLIQVIPSSDVSEITDLYRMLASAYQPGVPIENNHGINQLILSIDTAILLSTEVGLERNTLLAVLLYRAVWDGLVEEKTVKEKFGSEVLNIIQRLIKTNSLYAKGAVIATENYRKLLLTFAQDVRVIIIMIADRLALMRMLRNNDDQKYIKQVASEAISLYVPLAHRLGLYSMKSEMEDLWLKYTYPDEYFAIAKQLSETKEERDKYIQTFIEPIKKRIEQTEHHFELKGRTKSIYSIRNKMIKQQAKIEEIHDLFAIRIILDVPLEKEKSACWQIYSIVTDLYQPNPKRMKDWISIPKSNGYESLHITVFGVENKRVEVQIRTRRMDEVAERGLAAHWKYKGGTGEAGLDQWLNGVRTLLEEGSEQGSIEVMKELKMDQYDKEVFLFTPAGDLYKLPKGATVLDFAFAIHSGLGTRCTGAKINGKNYPIKHILQSGDTVEILTSNNQTPKQDWLNIVITSKARIKIKQMLKEAENKAIEFGKELLQRRFKNRKIEQDEAVMTKLIKKMGFKTATAFYSELTSEQIDINDVLDLYVQLSAKEEPSNTELRSAQEFKAEFAREKEEKKEDELVIGQNVKGLEFKLARCCNPIYGDEIFGFISTQGGVKIHRSDCPNAPQMQERFHYRIVKARWSGKQGSQYIVPLRIIGRDDIGIVTNATSVISKEKGVALRNIQIESNDGLFQGHLTLLVSDTSVVESLIKKLLGVKGVKSVERTK